MIMKDQTQEATIIIKDFNLYRDNFIPYWNYDSEI